MGEKDEEGMQAGSLTEYNDDGNSRGASMSVFLLTLPWSGEYRFRFCNEIIVSTLKMKFFVALLLLSIVTYDTVHIVCITF